MITAAWQLGSGRLPGNRGSGNGHTCSATAATSSPNPAATPSPSAALRAARTAHRRAQRHPGGERDPWGRPLDESVVLVLSTWTYAGTGYTTTPGAELATASAARAREHHDQADAAA